MIAKSRKVVAFWDVTPFSLVEIFYRFGRSSCLNFQIMLSAGGRDSKLRQIHSSKLAEGRQIIKQWMVHKRDETTRVQ
jgi:hypothetical protein